MPACSRMKPARIFFTNGIADSARTSRVRHEGVAKLNRVGAGAVHREERIARHAGDVRVAAIGEEHHLLPAVLALEDGAEQMVRAPRLDTQGRAPLTR